MYTPSEVALKYSGIAPRRRAADARYPPPALVRNRFETVLWAAKHLLARPNRDGTRGAAPAAPTAGPTSSAAAAATPGRNGPLLLTVARGYPRDTDSTTALNWAGSVTVSPCSSRWPVKVPSTAPVRTFVTV